MIMIVRIGQKMMMGWSLLLLSIKREDIWDFITTKDLSHIHTQLWGHALQFPPHTLLTSRPFFTLPPLLQQNRRYNIWLQNKINLNKWLPRYNYKYTLTSTARANCHLRHDFPFPSLLRPGRFHLTDAPCPRMWRRRRSLRPPPRCRKG